MQLIPWEVLIPLVIVIGLLYFIVRSKRKGRDTGRRRG